MQKERPDERSSHHESSKVIGTEAIVIEVIARKTIAIVATKAAELNEKNPAVMIAIVVNQIENQDEIDRDREVKIVKEQKRVDRENEKDPETEKT